MSSESEKSARAQEEMQREQPRIDRGYVAWVNSSVGREFIKAKSSMQDVQRGENPRYGWPVDSEGEYLPTEGPIRVFCGTVDERAPEGWVKVNGFADLQKLMLAQIVVEYSVCDAHKLVDFIASNYYGYQLVFWPRDGLTERTSREDRKAELTRKIEELTQAAGVKLEMTRNAEGHIHYLTTERAREYDPEPGGGRQPEGPES
jgi:hypothetical protein